MDIRVRAPRYFVRLVHLPEDRLYAFHFEFDPRTNNPHYPIPDYLKNVTIGYDHEDKEFMITKAPLDTSKGARVIFQFSGNISYRDVPFLKIWVDPEYEYAAYAYSELYYLLEREGALGNVFLRAMMAAHGGPGRGKCSSQALLAWAIDTLRRHTRVLPLQEMYRAGDLIFYQ